MSHFGAHVGILAASGSKDPVAFRSAGTADFQVDDGSGAFSVAPGTPAGKAVGDLLIAQLSVTLGVPTITSIDVPAGWADWGQITDGTSKRSQRLVARWADGTAADNPGFTATASATSLNGVFGARIYAFSGGAGSGDARSGPSGTSRATSTTMTQEPFTTTVANCLGAHFLTIHAFSGATASFTGESNANLTETSVSNTTTGLDMTLQLQTGLVATAATVSGGTFTIGSSSIHTTQSFGIKNS